MSNHSTDPGKMACRHEPNDPVCEFIHICAHCRVPIEPVYCAACDGIGLAGTSDRRCPVCRGTGIDRWEAAT